MSSVLYEPFTYRKKFFAFTYKALYLLLFNYSSDAGPAERAILFLSRCSLSSSDCACAVTAGVSPPLTSRGVPGRMGWGGVCVLRRPEGLDDNCVDGGNDSPLPCGVLSSSQHRPDSRHLFSKPRCRESFEHSLLDVGTSFSRFLNTHLSFCSVNLFSFVIRCTHQQVLKKFIQQEGKRNVPPVLRELRYLRKVAPSVFVRLSYLHARLSSAQTSNFHPFLSFQTSNFHPFLSLKLIIRSSFFLETSSIRLNLLSTFNLRAVLRSWKR